MPRKFLRSTFLQIFSCLYLSLFLAACGSASKPVAAQSEPQAKQPEPTVPQSREADDVARFFAGMPGKQGSPFADLEGSAVWREHQQKLDAAWAKTKEQLLDSLRAFEQQELRPAELDKRVVYYPFSGPDSLTPLQYFPRSPLYIMVALEPPGTLPDRNMVEHKELPGYLAAIRTTMSDILGRSFFVTREMDKQLRGQVTDGTILPILHLLVRTGHNILGYRYIRINDNGQIVDRTAKYQADQRYANRGIEVEFQSAIDAPAQHLYYFSVNFDDAHLKTNPSFHAYLKSLHDTTTMLKATSYMPHHDEFSLIRSQILGASTAILQDDSGVPFHFYAPDQWKVQLYGDYQKPYGSFAWLEQKDLREAYKTGAKPLPLHIGYGYRRITSNLQLATRVQVSSAK